MHHISIAHLFFEQHIQKGDCIVDATMGNGHDTLFLAKTLIKAGGGKLLAMDIQKEALKATQSRLEKENLFPQNQKNLLIDLLLASHDDLSFLSPPISLFVYNLGYLPGKNHHLTTQSETTLKSLISAFLLLDAKRGAFSITCYPGHPEGKKELEIVQNFLMTQIKKFTISIHKRLSINPLVPVLFLGQRQRFED